MQIDNKKLARSFGIGDNHYDRWLKFVNRESETGDNVFRVEGMIVSSSTENFMPGDGVGFTTSNMMREFLDRNKGKDIRIDVNSPGGDIFEANAMISDLLRHDGKIEVYAIGAAFSAAADFFTIKGAERIAMPGSMFMIHNATTLAMGDANQIRKVVERLEKINEQCADRMSDAWDIDRNELLNLMDEETWFTETEAADRGIVDRVWSDAAEVSDDGEVERVVKRGNEAALLRILAVAN